MNRTTRIAAVLFLASSLWNPSHSSAGTPAGQLQETWKQIVVILQSARFDSESEIEAFRNKVMQVVSPRFDFGEMSKRCLSPYWEGRTGEEKEQFVKLFAARLARSYIGGFRSYKDSTVLYTREANDTNGAKVDTKIVSHGAKDLLVNYKMHFIEEDWKVYDVIIDDISLVGNYRAQFRRVISQSSFQDLIRMMKEK